MITNNNGLAFAARIIAVGVVTFVELTPSLAKADPKLAPYGPSYATSRVDAAFDLVAAMLPVAIVMVPMANKGDLPMPLGCIAMSGDPQAECMDVAYELPSEGPIVVETRLANASILKRIYAIAVANLTGDELLLQSEKKHLD